jgi:Icc-related predicted phosphoesterase
MENILLVTRPSYDDGTAYLSRYAFLVLKLAKSKNVEFKDFEGKQANTKNILKFVYKKNPKLFFINGHGTKEALEGDKGEILFSVDKNLNILKDKIVYARACHAGLLLGKKIVENNEGCFIGYKEPFSFWIDGTRSSTPLKDKTAALFLKPSNEIINCLLNGKTTKESFEISQKGMIESMQKVLELNKKKEPEAMGLLQVLWTNYQGQVLCGNENLVF